MADVLVFDTRAAQVGAHCPVDWGWVVADRLVRWVCGLTLAFSVAAAGPVSAQSAVEVDKLNSEIIRLYQVGKYAEAISLAQQVLAISEKTLGPDHPDVAQSLNNLALLYHSQGRPTEAERLMKRGLSIAEKALGPDDPNVGASLNNLAGFYQSQGRYAEAEPAMKRGLAIREKALGPDHPDVGQSLNNLAELYRSQGRYAEAEPLYKRGLAIREKALGPDHPDVGESLNNLAELYRSQGRTAEAEPLLKRCLAITETALGPDHPQVGTSLNNLAGLYVGQGRTTEAEPLLKRSLTIAEKALGPDHPQVGISLHNLAMLYQEQGRTVEAEPLMRRGLTITEKALGTDHPQVGQFLGGLAFLALSQNDLAAAADLWRRASAMLQRRAERGLGGASGGSSKGEKQKDSWYFRGLIKTSHRLAAKGRANVKQVDAEMFSIAQWAQGSEAAASLAQMAARSAGGSPELTALVREHQDLVAEWQAKDKLLIAARSEPPQRRNASGEKLLSDRLADIDARLAAINARLSRDFPDYAGLATPKPTSVSDVQAALRDDEALMLFLDTVKIKPLPEESFIWVVTKSEVHWIRSDLGTAALAREIAALRCGLDSTSWRGEGAKRCTDLLDAKPEEVPLGDDPLPFDAARAYRLYKGLFGKIEDLIKGKQLLIVPSGALTRLPFQVLVTRPPSSTDLRSVHWLARDHAITILPAVSSLKALRRIGRPNPSKRPIIIGFGNPLLDGLQADPEDGAHFKELAALARAQVNCASGASIRTAALRGLRLNVESVPQVGGLANLAYLRALSPLPETADELCAVARELRADVGDIRIGARATETEIKRLSASGDLARYRIVHFATHGTLAGELKGTSEPGLILTPPQKATAEDDGYLSGSEVASLKLDADWVILSACNTAGGEGKGEAAEALSGLARAFFYAGARALLVSHWAVNSETTVKLITSAVGETARDPKVGRTEALRRAMLTLVDNGTAEQAHPAYWAPFVVVGDGGMDR